MVVRLTDSDESFSFRFMGKVGSNRTTECEIQRIDYFDLCTTLEINTQNYFEDSSAEHGGLEICWVLGESEHYRGFRGSLVRVHRENVMIINANEPHSEICSRSPTIPHLRSLILSPRFLDDLLEEHSLNSKEMAFEGVHFPLEGRFKECLHQLFLFKEIPGCSRFALDSLLTEIGQSVTTQFKHSRSDRIAKLQSQGHFPDVCVRAKGIMSENLHDPAFSLDVLAKNVGMSKFHLVRIFKREVGLTPHAYYRILRVERVKERLLNSRQPITEIAYGVGFDDLSTFNKAFKMVAGVTPSEFRQVHGKCGNSRPD